MKVETIKTVPVPLSIEMIDVQDSECLNVIKFSEIKRQFWTNLTKISRYSLEMFTNIHNLALGFDKILLNLGDYRIG
jgi:hypothetical protein